MTRDHARDRSEPVHPQNAVRGVILELPGSDGKLPRACFASCWPSSEPQSPPSRPHGELALENLALRQQLSVLRHQVKRARPTTMDRAFWVVASQVWDRWRDTLVIVKPETVIRWHRRGFARYTAKLTHMTNLYTVALAERCSVPGQYVEVSVPARGD